jgi:hypothetical protein
MAQLSVSIIAEQIMQRRRYGWAIAILSMTLLPAHRARAQDPPPTVNLTVNTTADLIDDNVGDGLCRTSANTCSLRAAVMQANHLTTPNLIVTISLPAGTFTLTRAPTPVNGEDTGDLNLTTPLAPDQSIVIVGTGATRTIIDANHIDRALRIASSRIAIIRRVVIRNGSPSGNPNFAGAGIANSGNLTLADSVVEDNAGNYGGGILNTGVMEMIDCTVRDNIASGIGGGLYLEGPTTIRRSSVYANTSDLSGGGIGVADIAGNHLYLSNSTLSYNITNGDGGAISNRSTTFLYNASIVGNDADHDQDQMGGNGGGAHNASAARLVVVNTLIADNTLGNVPVYNDCDGILEAHGWNLFNVTSGCSIPNGTAWGFIEPNTIGPLQDNGGATFTHALLPGSRAIDTTDNALGCIDDSGTPLTTDQRGLPRVVGPRCDVGAFEFGAGPLFVNGFE